MLFGNSQKKKIGLNIPCKHWVTYIVFVSYNFLLNNNNILYCSILLQIYVTYNLVYCFLLENLIQNITESIN